MDIPFPIIGSVILVCDVDVSFIYHWEFIKKNDSGFVEPVDIIQPNATDYTYLPGALEPGMYARISNYIYHNVGGEIT